MKAILCFGDSITFGMGKQGGWVGKLKKYFEPMGEHHGVYNLGIPGNSSTDLIKRFDVEAGSRIRYIWPDDDYMIIIAIGINDSRGLEKPDNLQTKPIDFRDNIDELVRKSKKHTKEVILLGLTPVNEDLVFPFENTYFSNRKIIEYSKIIEETCKVNKAFYIDLYKELTKKKPNSLLLDGLHPNSKGYEAIFKILKSKLGYWLN